MSNPADLFPDIQANAGKYLQAATGRHFEERIAHTIDRLGFTRILPTDLPDLRAVKESVKETTNADLVNNVGDYRRHFVFQPFGSQDYPDFLLFSGDYVIAIETKYSNSGQRKPIWNSGLPRLNGVYVFGSYKAMDITFFKGGDILTADEIRALRRFFDAMKAEQDKFNTSAMGGQSYGFNAYVRRAFDQNKRYNKNAVLDFFQNPGRRRLEAEVIRYVKS